MFFHRTLTDIQLAGDFPLRIAVDLFQHKCAAALDRQLPHRLAEVRELLVAGHSLEGAVACVTQVEPKVKLLVHAHRQPRLGALHIVERQVARGAQHKRARLLYTATLGRLADPHIGLLDDVLYLLRRRYAGNQPRQTAANTEEDARQPVIIRHKTARCY